ncbi:MASE1 domain-containing protein [Dyella humi]|uniref:MASE1 domain-containing protein n=1 Tax=Dyella humi TaxID=1770547 RepID=A0ABW8IJI9_9GAMM
MLRQIAVLLGYAAGYTALHAISFSHWSIFAGFELAALILLPYRYWFALAVGEMIPSASVAIDCVNSFGLTWALLKAFPSICFVMPFVFGCRERLGLLGRRGEFANPTVLVLCAGLAALVVSGYNTFMLSFAPRPLGFEPLHEWMLRYVLGHFLGILTLTPLILAARDAMRGKSLRQLVAEIQDSRLLLESAGILIPTLGMLIWIGSRSAMGSDVRYIAQVAMFLPVVMLALRHGWLGAAISGSAASIAIVVLMPARYDHATVQAQTLMAFVLPTMLIIGTKITAWHRQEQQEKLDMRKALALAQRNYFEGEQQLRRAATMLREMQTMGTTWLRHTTRIEGYQRAQPLMAAASQFIEFCDPLEGTGRSLPHAVQKGSLAQVLALHHVPFRATYYGGVSTLPTTLHLAIYRMICASVAQLAEQDYLGEVVISVRCRQYRSQRWVVLRVLGKEARGASLSHTGTAALQQLSRHNSFQSLRDSAATFGGAARQRTRGRWRHLTIALSDA